MAGGLGAFLSAVLLDRGERQRGMAEAIPAPPRPVVLPETDDTHDDGGEIGVNHADVVFLEYRDLKGDRSFRRVTIRGIKPKGGGDMHILAYCHERRAPRTFLASGIVEVIDPATGEVHADGGAFLRRHVLFDRRAGAPTFLDALVRRHRPAMVVFTYTARCDGRLDPREEAAIALWLAARTRKELPTDDLFLHLRRLRPTLADYTDALGTFLDRASDARAARFAEDIAAVILADESVSAEERALFDTMRAQFSARGFEVRMARA